MKNCMLKLLDKRIDIGDKQCENYFKCYSCAKCASDKTASTLSTRY